MNKLQPSAYYYGRASEKDIIYNYMFLNNNKNLTNTFWMDSIGLHYVTIHPTQVVQLQQPVIIAVLCSFDAEDYYNLFPLQSNNTNSNGVSSINSMARRAISDLLGWSKKPKLDPSGKEWMVDMATWQKTRLLHLSHECKKVRLTLNPFEIWLDTTGHCDATVWPISAHLYWQGLKPSCEYDAEGWNEALTRCLLAADAP